GLPPGRLSGQLREIWLHTAKRFDPDRAKFRDSGKCSESGESPQPWIPLGKFTSRTSLTDTENCMNSPSEAEQHERIPTAVFQSSDTAVRVVAVSIALLIRRRRDEDRSVVLGLATGSTPVKLYRELIRLHRDEGLSFRNVVTFNLDEYYGLAPHHPESYR